MHSIEVPRCNSKPALRRTKVTVRPPRCAYLVHTEAAPGWIHSLISYLTGVRSGINQLLVPFGEQTVDDNWAQTIRKYRPDCLVTMGDAAKARHQFPGIPVHQFDQAFLAERVERRDVCCNIPMEYYLDHLWRESKSWDGSKIRFYDGDLSCDVGFCCSLAFGIPSATYRTFLDKSIQAVELVPESRLEPYLGLLTGSSKDFTTPLGLTRHELSDSRGHSSIPGTLLFGLTADSRTWIEELCRFWSVRACYDGYPWTRVVPLPAKLDWPSAAPFVANFLRTSLRTTSAFALVLPGGRELERQAASLLLEQLDGSRINNAVFVKHGSLETRRVFELEKPTDVWVQDNSIAANFSRPEYLLRWRQGVYVDVDLGMLGVSEPAELHGAGVDSFPEIGSQASTRYVRDSDILETEVDNYDVSVARLLAHQGYSFTLTDKAKYAHGILQRVGGAERLGWLAEKNVADLLSDLARKTKALSVDEIRRRLRWSQPDSVSEFLLARLNEGLFLSGYELRCPRCDMLQWQTIDSVRAQYACAGCETLLRLPLAPKLLYRPNELLVRAVGQGAIPLLLLLRALQSLARNGGYSYIPGIEVQRDGKRLDIDVVATCDGHTVFCEAKTLAAGGGDETHDQVIQQLGELIQLADEVGVHVCIFASLMPEVPAEFEKKFNELAGRFPQMTLVHASRAWLLEGLIPSTESPCEEDGRMKPACIRSLVPERGESLSLSFLHPCRGVTTAL